ncbi:MAG: HU family DNA-binding protein [Clostridia bacterium]|nr:HU family DNA-binding protein [Clostridia bacterium]
MVKTEFIRIMADKAGMSVEEARLAFDAFVETIKEVLPDEKSITIAGFGKFELKEKPAGKGISPKTGEVIDVPARNVPGFKFCKAFKEMF